MRDKTHAEQIERWAKFVKSNPINIWKPILNEFIDAQFEIADRFYKNLEKTDKGKVILQRLIEEKRKLK